VRMGAAAVSMLPGPQRARAALALHFVSPPGFSDPAAVIGMLGRGTHELAVRLFASKGWGDRGDVDEMAALQGGFDSDSTALSALDDLGRTLEEFTTLGGALPSGAPAARDEALLRIASLQLELKELRKAAASTPDLASPHATNAALAAAAAAAAAAHLPPPGYHIAPPPPPPPPSVKPPEGSMVPISLTASTDVLVRAAACERDVITPLTQLPYVMARWMDNDRLEALDTITGATELTSMPEPAGQGAWAFLFCSGACTKKLQYGISSVVHNFHDRLRVWVDGTAVSSLGGIASRAAGGLLLRGTIKDCVGHFALRATQIIQVYAAHPSTDVESAVHIASHEGLLGDHTNSKDILMGIKNFESLVLCEAWGGPGQVVMLPRADRPSQGAFGFTGLVAACSAAGLGPSQTIEVLDKTFMEIRDEAAERRRTRGAKVVDVVKIVLRNKGVRVLETASREQSMAAGAEGARLALLQYGGQMHTPPGSATHSRAVLSPSHLGTPPRSPSAFSLQSEQDAGVRRWRDVPSPSAHRPQARGEIRDRSRSRSPSREMTDRRDGRGLRDRSRDSMGANRLRLRVGTPDADKEVERLALGMASPADSRPGDMRVAAGGDNKQERTADRDRDRHSRSRSPARDRDDSSLERKGGSTPLRPPSPAGELITHRAGLARAFRQRLQQLGLPHTCPFVACGGTCSNAACEDCKSAARFDPRKHGPVVEELKRKVDAAFNFRWRDTG
jgi:hypothetical protein